MLARPAAMAGGHPPKPVLIPPAPAAPVFIPDDAKFSTGGGLIGGAIGWNAQYGAWVFGIEGDYSYAAVSGHSDFCGTTGNSCGSRLESLGTVRGRVGAVANDWMLYATGGWAFGEVSGYSTAKLSGDAAGQSARASKSALLRNGR